ncbi:MAG TPA: PmoA family protein, partial [Candidatus Dormibacteraeota bacterium]|nr:PmoA family protein [Candidatus Dormibacteraeota bacterium]
HHGIWSAWTSSEFDGRKSNFWESKEKQGKVECVKVEAMTSGPVFGGFRARHQFINLNGPDGPKVALEEVWEVRAYALTDRFIFDLISTQTCASDKPLIIKEYRYGGIGFRGSAEWEGKTGVQFLTSEGKDRIGGHATKAKWCTATGKVGAADATVGFLCHPSDFRFPQPMRIHPDEPFFNWAVPQGGEFSIVPGTPYVARYRFVVADGTLSRESLDAAWEAYGSPQKIEIQSGSRHK